MAFIIAGFYLSSALKHDAGSASAGLKSRAIAIALGDDYVESYLKAAKSYSVGEVTKPSPGDYDYSGETDRLVVPLRVESVYAKSVLFVTVDLDENRTVCIYNDRPGTLSERLKMDSVKMALNDSEVISLLDDNGANPLQGSDFRGPAAYVIDNVTPAGDDTGYGYLGGVSSCVDVRLFPGDFLIVDVIVDPANGTVLADRVHSPGPYGDVFTVTIPPGGSFYRSFGGEYANNVIANFSVMADNASRTAIPYPVTVCAINDTGAPGIRAIFVDTDNFNRLRNGIAYKTLGDHIVNDKGWAMTMPEGTDFYMVLCNNASKEAVVSMVI